MIWSFLAVLFSGWLYVDASYRGPQWQRWVFKPVTMLLLLAWAWQAPVLATTDYLILLGVLATLVGDALTLLPTKRMLYAIGAFFLSHLLYTLYFASQTLLPAKTRAFVDHVTNAFREHNLARRFSAEE